MSVEKAKELFLGKGARPMNCAQAVACSFPERFESGHDLIERFEGYGSGKAPEGYCGALMAAMDSLKTKPHQVERIKAYFVRHAGSLQCKEIRRRRMLSCAGCVQKAAEFLGAVPECKNEG